MLGGISNRTESTGISYREVGEDLAVDETAYSLESIDELAVGDPIDFRCDANSDRPEAAKIALALLAVLVVVRKRCHHSVFAQLQVIFAIAIEPLAQLQESLCSAARRYRIRYSYHCYTPIRILNIFSWPSSTSLDFPRLLLRLELFFVKICRRPGRVLFSFPVPVTLNRALTALRVFIFGTGCFSFLRSFDHRFFLLAARSKCCRHRASQ